MSFIKPCYSPHSVTATEPAIQIDFSGHYSDHIYRKYDEAHISIVIVYYFSHIINIFRLKKVVLLYKVVLFCHIQIASHCMSDPDVKIHQT